MNFNENPSPRGHFFQRQQAHNLKQHHRKRQAKFYAIIGLIALCFGSCLLLWVWLSPYTPQTVPNKNAQPLQLNTKVKSAIVVDAKTGQIVAEKNAQQLVGIASQSKMLTAYETLKQIHAGKLHWHDEITINPKTDWSAKDDQVYAHLNMHAGQKVTVQSLFDAMYTNSANDAALALADFIKPAELSQYQALNLWARELNLTKSQWYNAAGQENKDAFAFQVPTAAPTAENKATVLQLAFLARKNLQLNPNLRSYYHRNRLVYYTNHRQRHVKQTEYHRLKTKILPQLQNPLNLQFEGLKSGSTPNSGGAFTGLMKDQQGHEFITVVSGSGSYTSQFNRYQNTIDIVNDVLRNQTPVSNQAGLKFHHFKQIYPSSTQSPVWVNKLKTS
ncbi:serine hydrolase [Fructilactobacillus frigidiflavus]|uniref:serine hydrolase n=1 Tax=Fructilactobacillus frigidiflavus TaxID=3242688 RepID=UPI0037579153